MQPPSLKLLRWQCRRGMLELDLLLLPYLEASYDSLPPAKQQLFTELLSFPDPDLYNWLMGYSSCPDTQYHPLIAEIRDYHQHQSHT